MKKKLFPLAAILFWLLVWQCAAAALKQSILLCTPLQAMQALLAMLPKPVFWRSIASTLSRISLGFFLGTLLGCLLALLSHRVRLIEFLLSPLLRILRSVPVASFIILLLIWFPSRLLSVLISFLMVLPILYGHMLRGMDMADPQLLEAAGIFRLSPFRTFRLIRLPAMSAHLQEGLALALGLCWKAGVAAEVIGIPSGSIGEKLYTAKVYLETPSLFAWTAVIILLSFLFEKLVMLLFSLSLRLMTEVRA